MKQSNFKESRLKEFYGTTFLNSDNSILDDKYLLNQFEQFLSETIDMAEREGYKKAKREHYSFIDTKSID